MKTILYLLTLVLSFGSVSILKYNGQVFRQNSSDDLMVQEVINDKKNDLSIGTKLANSLLRECSIFTGKITDIRPTDDPNAFKVDFTIEDWLVNNSTSIENRIQLDYLRGYYKSDSPAENWQNVKVEIGAKLLIASNCQNNSNAGKYALVTSEDQYFQSVRNVITYHFDVEKNKKKLFNVSQILNSQNDNIFAGYIIRRIDLFGIVYADDNTQILLGLLGDKHLPKGSWESISTHIDYLMKGNKVLLPETKNLVINKFVAMGSSDDMDDSEQGVRSLIRLCENNAFNITPFLNSEKRNKLVQNYQKLSSPKKSIKGKEEFERQLMIN